MESDEYRYIRLEGLLIIVRIGVIFVIIVALDIDHALAGFLEPPTAPCTDAFVNTLGRPQ